MQYLRFKFANHFKKIIIGVLFLSGFFFATYKIDSTPHVWGDEGIFIQLGRTLVDHGLMTIPVAPNRFSDKPFLYSISTSYPVVLPVGIFMKIFGVGIVQARAPMVIYLIGTLVGLYILGAHIYTSRISILLLGIFVFFGPLYGNGKPVQGEVPAFFWFIWACICFLRLKNNNKRSLFIFFGGFFLGLAGVAKIPFLPFVLLSWALFIIMVFRRSNWIKDFLSISFGLFIPVFLWVKLALPNISIENLSNILSIINKFVTNGYQYNWFSSAIFFRDTTLLYFTFLTGMVIIAFFLNSFSNIRKLDFEYKYIFGCFFIGFYWFFYWFVRSPGWLRYAFPFQLFVLFLLPFSITTIVKYFNLKYILSSYFLIVVIFIHFCVLLNSFKNFHSTRIPIFLEENRKLFIDNKIVIGVYNFPEVAAFLPFSNLIQYVNILEPDGFNPIYFCVDYLIVDHAEGDVLKNILSRYVQVNSIDQKIGVFKKLMTCKRAVP